MKTPKRIKCKWCGNKFTRLQPLQSVCTFECAIDLAQDKRNKADLKKWQKRKKSLKDNTTTLSQLKKKLEVNINGIIRKIDYGCNCMMCDLPIRSPSACHYHSVGSNDSLRFNLFNIWAGCYSCNGNKGGNIQGYDVQLIQHYGKPRWEHLKFTLVAEHPLIKLSREEIKELTKRTQKILNELEAKKRTSMERWLIRERLNKEIGIY